MRGGQELDLANPPLHLHSLDLVRQHGSSDHRRAEFCRREAQGAGKKTEDENAP
jgi:hypothetical protein